jgi:hypothetical protein
VPAKPQPWYTSLNQPPRSPKDGRNRRAAAPPHRRPTDRTDPGVDPAGAQQDFTFYTFGTNTIFTFDPPPTPNIPYAGVRAGELIGYRMWLVLEDLQLCSLVHHFIWTPGATIEGNVDEVVANPMPWGRLLYGGVYSYSTPDHIIPEITNTSPKDFPTLASFTGWNSFFHIHALAIGTIKCWGEVIEHEKGYRAQYAKLRSIDEVIGPVGINALRRRYLL